MALPALPTLYFILLAFVLGIHAAPIQPSQPSLSNAQSSSGWSTEAFIALAGVFVTLLGILITLAASSKLRRKLKRCITRNHQQSVQQLRQKYDDYRKFQEWLEMTS